MKLAQLHRMPHRTNLGFTLVEMAMVLAIVALLMAGLLPSLSSQVEQQRRAETRKQIDVIQQALMGFAVINGRLPCPSTTTDPADTNYGAEDATCTSAPTSEGYLPWKTLGVPEIDAWGSKRNDSGAQWLGYWRYRVNRNFAVPFSMTTNPDTADKLVVKDLSGNLLTSATERPVAIVFSTGPDLTGNLENASSSFEATTGTYHSDTPSSTFDDILIWISRPQLINRMVAAGKLP
jgi:prepilin-type N-terminal cleavage/methylation domain-containing protein